jgi:hypothetical protein
MHHIIKYRKILSDISLSFGPLWFGARSLFAKQRLAATRAHLPWIQQAVLSGGQRRVV